MIRGFNPIIVEEAIKSADGIDEALGKKSFNPIIVEEAIKSCRELCYSEARRGGFNPIIVEETIKRACGTT